MAALCHLVRRSPPTPAPSFSRGTSAVLTNHPLIQDAKQAMRQLGNASGEGVAGAARGRDVAVTLLVAVLVLIEASEQQRPMSCSKPGNSWAKAGSYLALEGV